MKNKLSTALLVGSLSLGNGTVVAGEEAQNVGVSPNLSDTTLIATKKKTQMTLDKSDIEESDHDKKMGEVLAQTIAKLPELNLSEDEKQKVIAILKNDDFQNEFYSLMKKEKIWSPEQIILSLLLGFLYGWAYFFTIRKIRDKGMPIDVKSFSIFGGTSGMMAILNGLVPGSLVYAESFILALTSVYLHIQNKRHNVPYEDGLFDRFANNIPLPVVRYNKEDMPLIWNKKMEEETGYSLADVSAYYKENGDVMSLLYKGEDLEKVRQYLEGLATSGKGYENIAFTMITKSGEAKTFLWTTLPDGSGGTMRIAKPLRDIGEIQAELEKARELLRKDPLTWAYNRKALEEDLHDSLSYQKRKTDCVNKVLVLLDLDGFKKINDRHGHLSGDTILKEFVAFVQANLREYDHIYRIGGDEFALLFESDNFDGVVQKLHKLRHDFFLRRILLEDDKTISSVGSSWGAVAFNNSLSTHMDDVGLIINDLKTQADKYMYVVKHCGLIEDNLVMKGKVGKGQLEKNGICKPLYNGEGQVIGAEIINEYGIFQLTQDELQIIRAIVERSFDTNSAR